MGCIGFLGLYCRGGKRGNILIFNCFDLGVVYIIVVYILLIRVSYLVLI